MNTFQGKIIKLDAINSTNVYLKELLTKEEINQTVVAVAHTQLNGKGQMGTVWSSEPGKNLTFSVLYDISFLKNVQQFYVSMAVSLAVFDVLNALLIPDLKIKWPNDILSGGKKLCGILIENTIREGKQQYSVAGVGLNVNQTLFPELPYATSLKAVTGISFNLEELLMHLLQKLTFYLDKLKFNEFSALKAQYLEALYRYNKPSTFKTAQGEILTGIIVNVTESGRLQLKLEDNRLNDYGLKEIALLN